MSNPYGNNPYGQQPPNPYGAPGGQPYGQQPAKTDVVSIIGFVLSLLCCGVVAIVLGIVGLGRTKNGQRKGRWAAIAAIVIGALGTLGVIGVFVLGGLLGGESVTDLESGQCIDGDGLRDDAASTVGSISVVSCSDTHDGEVLATGELTSDQASQVDAGERSDVCVQELSDDEVAAVTSGDYSVFPLTEDTSPSEGESFACVLVNADGSALEEKVGD